jgi:hypothetical protein
MKKFEGKMKIRMIKTTRGSENGIQINEYEAGKVYDVNFSLANVFVRVLRVADLVQEEKSIASAPENKTIQPEEVKQEGLEVKEEVPNFVYKPRGRRS